MMEMTLLPASFIALAIGYMVAVPKPPPTQQTVPNFSTSVGMPSGPTKFRMESPVWRAASLCWSSPPP